MVLLARISPDHRELAEAGADARGVSLARYVELLIEGDEIARCYRPEGEPRQMDLDEDAAPGGLEGDP